MKLKITLNEDHIKLMKCLYFQDFNSKVGIDKFNPLGGSLLFEDMARILGLTDHIIPETIEDWDGAKFDEETTDKLQELGGFLAENLLAMEEILHQFCDVGIKVGTYTCLDNVRIWKYEGVE
jgi:hypothetical protein